MAILTGRLGFRDFLFGLANERNDMFGDAETVPFGAFQGSKDLLVGGAEGDNRLFGDVGGWLAGGYNDAGEAEYVVGGDDLLIGGRDSENSLYGDAGTMSLEYHHDLDYLNGGTRGGDDLLIGGLRSTNRLYGDAEWLDAGAEGGDDLLFGGAHSTNYLYGDAWILGDSYDLVFAVCGDDTLVGGAWSTNHLYGDGAITNDDPVVSGDDTLIGGRNSTNYLYGDASPDAVGEGGDDLLKGGAKSTNYLYGDVNSLYQMSVFDCGADTLIGGARSENHLYGDAEYIERLGTTYCGDDLLIAGRGGSNFLYGDAREIYDWDFGGSITAGDDRLISDRGDDQMWGDFALGGESISGGADAFVFNRKNGADVIHDFEQGKDIIELHGFTRKINTFEGTHAEFRQLSHAERESYREKVAWTFEDLSIQVSDGNSIISTGGEHSVTVRGVDNLTADDFAFFIEAETWDFA